MAPKTVSVPTGVLEEHEEEIRPLDLPKACQTPDGRKLHIVWRNVILFAYLHMAGVYGAYLMFTSAKIKTSAWGEFESLSIVFIA